MRLIALLICLAIVVYSSFHKKLKTWNYLEQYLLFMQRQVAIQNGWATIAMLLVPPAILVWLGQWLFKTPLFGFLGLAYAVIVLLICLGPYHIESEVPQATADTVFQRANDNIFAVILWFIVLGPVGALTYRLITLLRGLADNPQTDFSHYLSQIQFVQAVGDWIPIRLSTLAYALAGDFVGCFSYWVKHVLKGIETNHQLLHESGLIALHLPTSAALTNSPQELQQAQSLIDRAVVITLIMVAIFTLGIVMA